MQRIIKVNEIDIDLEHVIAVGGVSKGDDIYSYYKVYLSSGIHIIIYHTDNFIGNKDAYMPREEFISKWIKK